jgi:hypothetical protein
MVKMSVIRAVSMMETVDMTGIMKAFPVEFQHDSQKVEFDVYEGGTEIALKGSFASQANIVNKDGFKTVTVNPMQINESITDSVANVNKTRIGQDTYGRDKGGLSASARQAIEEDAKGFGKLKKRAQRLLKKSAYDVLTTGKVTVSAQGVVVDEINYGLTNIIVNDNSTAGIYQWNDTTNSDPIMQLETQAVNMKQYSVDTYIMGSEAQKAFIKHPKVLTSDNVTTGKKANFFSPTKEERASKSTDTLLFMGTTAGDYGKSVELYVELDQYNDGTQDVAYLNKNYCVGFKAGNEDNAQIQYGNIPVTSGEGANVAISTFVGKEHLDGRISKNPVGVERFYRTSPLPTMNQPKAFVSIKATLIA